MTRSCNNPYDLNLSRVWNTLRCSQWQSYDEYKHKVINISEIRNVKRWGINDFILIFGLNQSVDLKIKIIIILMPFYIETLINI